MAAVTKTFSGATASRDAGITQSAVWSLITPCLEVRIRAKKARFNHKCHVFKLSFLHCALLVFHYRILCDRVFDHFRK